MANPLHKLFDAFSSKDGSVLGIDISSSSIKLVQLGRKKGKAELETYGELALGPYAGIDIGQATNLPPDKIAAAIKDLMKDAKVSTKRAGVAIPLSSSLISIMELPQVDQKELKDMIPLEVRKYIPVPITEVMLDWWVIPKDIEAASENEGEKKDPIKNIEVLFVAIHKETISKYQQIITGAGLQAAFFEIEIFSTIRSVLDESLQPVMILDVGSSISKVYIIDRRVIRESHTINRGSQDITIALSRSMNLTVAKAEEAKRGSGIVANLGPNQVAESSSLILDNVFSEANRTLLHYQKRYNKSISKVVLTGGGSLLEGILPAARAAFQTDVELANPFAKLEYPAFLQNVLIKAGPEFAVAIGTGLRLLEESN